MNWNDNKEIACRIAEISTWDFDQAFRALEAGGQARESALSVLWSREKSCRTLEQLAEARRSIRRYRLGLL
jgi:hypothetical protein